MLRVEQKYPWVKINPETARRFGVADGDWVRVESPHGHARFVAEYFEGIAPGVLMARRGWWQPCDALSRPGYSWGDGGSEPSVLYSTERAAFDPFHSAMPKQTLVRIESLGPAEGVGRTEGIGVFSASDSDDASFGAFSFDATKCIGCKACAVVCKQVRGLAPSEETRRWVIDETIGSFPQVKRSFASRSCQHCAHPACAKVCPAQAISRCESGAVVVDKARCVGCRRCATACEYDVPRFVAGVMDKCDCCVGLLGGNVAQDALFGRSRYAWSGCGGARGGGSCAQSAASEHCEWKGVPPCVATCPTGALRFNFAAESFARSNAEDLAR